MRGKNRGKKSTSAPLPPVVSSFLFAALCGGRRSRQTAQALGFCPSHMCRRVSLCPQDGTNPHVPPAAPDFGARRGWGGWQGPKRGPRATKRGWQGHKQGWQGHKQGWPPRSAPGTAQNEPFPARVPAPCLQALPPLRRAGGWFQSSVTERKQGQE